MTSINDLSQLYDSSSAVFFDSTVHGDGGLHVHYGLFQPGSESTTEATHATVALMVRLLQTVGGVTLTPHTRILDLGAGLGGPMHQVVASSGCQAVCLNLCEKQNETNQQQVARLGLDAQITVLQGDMRELPSDWAETFDVVWSQDAFLHNEEKGQILKEAYKVLKRGAILVFSDIMAADNCSQLNVRSFQQRNHVTELGSPGIYTTLLQQAQFGVLVYHDLSSYMPENFIRMARSIEVNERKLEEAGISAKYMQDYRESLKNSVKEAEDGSLRWGIFVCKKL
jgi:sarcosine/dimethylglycine N-methyltransferase